MAKIDCSKLRTPTAACVRAACEEFGRDNELIEGTLGELLDQHRSNRDRKYVFLKVVALNFLYSTRIDLYSTKRPDVEDVARHIHDNFNEIDAALDARPPKLEIVDRINSVTVSGKQRRSCFSFATKYCSWHRPESYAIWDSNVKVYLRCLQKQAGFRADFKLDGDWKYPMFHGVMADLVKCYGLGEFTLKDIDKFLWLEGKRIKNSGAQI